MAKDIGLYAKVWAKMPGWGSGAPTCPWLTRHTSPAWDLGCGQRGTGLEVEGTRLQS